MIDSIIDALADVYRSHFTKAAGQLWIKRITKAVPEAVPEWPWMYFVIDDGDIEVATYKGNHQATYPRWPMITGQSRGTVNRLSIDITHRFKAQLLVRPRRDLHEDESLVRPFVEPIITLTVENIDLGGACKQVIPTRYDYGVFPFGTSEEKVVNFIGLELEFEALEYV